MIFKYDRSDFFSSALDERESRAAKIESYNHNYFLKNETGENIIKTHRYIDKYNDLETIKGSVSAAVWAMKEKA